MNLTERLHLYIQLTRLNRPIGILLLLWPTLWGVWIAGNGHPSWVIIVIFTLGTVLMRSSGCAVNDYADRHIDKHVKRTQERPLTSGKISEREALCVAIPQAYLGIAFGFGIPMAFAAQLGHVPPVAWVLLLANVFWAVAYDTEYAMVDRDDDIHLGIHSSALFFGRYDVMAVMACYTITLVLLALAGLMTGLGLVYFAGLIVAAGVAIHHYTLIRDRTREKCFAAFLHNNWFGAAVF